MSTADDRSLRRADGVGLDTQRLVSGIIIEMFTLCCWECKQVEHHWQAGGGTIIKAGVPYLVIPLHVCGWKCSDHVHYSPSLETVNVIRRMAKQMSGVFMCSKAVE